MRSLKLQNGDLVFDSLGKLVFVKDLDMIIQSINMKLQTHKGELFYNENYGLEKVKGKITQERILDILNDTLLDDKIKEITITNFDIRYTNLYIDINIRLNTEQLVNLNIII